MFEQCRLGALSHLLLSMGPARFVPDEVSFLFCYRLVVLIVGLNITSIIVHCVFF